MNDLFREKLRELYEEKRQVLFAYALAITREPGAAEDAVQHAFERLLALDRLPARLEPYVYRSIRNAAFDTKRAKRHEGTHSEDVQVQAVPEITLRVEINEMLDRLSADERETIVLKVFGSMTFQEIADLRDEALNTVASWYRRGIGKMRDALERGRA